MIQVIFCAIKYPFVLWFAPNATEMERIDMKEEYTDVMYLVIGARQISKTLYDMSNRFDVIIHSFVGKILIWPVALRLCIYCATHISSVLRNCMYNASIHAIQPTSTKSC